MYTHLQLRDSARPPVTLATLHKMRDEGEAIASLTCYDASFAALVDEADVDVGSSVIRSAWSSRAMTLRCRSRSTM
jgi:ketopantoate hydroxymethyltransferase